MQEGHLQALEEQFGLRRTRIETVDHLRRRFGLSASQAAALYEEFVQQKTAKTRRVIAAILLSGAVSLVGHIVLSQVTDSFHISFASALATFVFALLFSPLVAWATLRNWRSTEQGALEAARTIFVYVLAIWALILDMFFVYGLFDLVVGFE